MDAQQTTHTTPQASNWPPEKVRQEADKLAAMEVQVRAIYDGLDARSKALITVLEQLSIMDGYSIIAYGNEIDNERMNDAECVKQALSENPDDQDLRTLAEAYQLACFIEKRSE